MPRLGVQQKVVLIAELIGFDFVKDINHIYVFIIFLGKLHLKVNTCRISSLHSINFRENNIDYTVLIDGVCRLKETYVYNTVEAPIKNRNFSQEV